MTLGAGTKLGPYEIVAPLGAGGMGEVYAARDTRLSRDVALKVLPADVASDAARLKRFEKEARSASALNHPNIVTIYDIGSSDAVSYIAMERVEGRTLREALFAGALPIRKLLPVAAQIADGLAKAHEAGIVHRDLKPENVMMTRDGLVKILDFGLAKVTSTASSEDVTHLPTETGTSPGVVLGTVGYMSPEQAAGQPLDFRSDQFSLGSILYELATGKRAFHRTNAIDTLSAILHEEPEAVARISPQAPTPLRWVIERCLAKDPAERYASTRDLARDIATIRDRIGEAATAEIVAPSARPTGLRIALWSLGTLAGLAAGLLVGRSLWKSPAPALPRFQQLTFAEGAIQSASFGPDGQSIVYGFSREGEPFVLYATRAGNTESRPLGINADILSVSRSGEMALVLGSRPGTLARMPLEGGAPREMLENVSSADWSPDGKSLAVVRVEGEKKRLEFPIGKTLFESTSFIGRPRVSRSGDRVLIEDAGSLAIVDPSRNVKTVGETAGASGAAWGPTGDEVWTSVVFGSTTELHALRPGGPKRVIATLPGTFLLQDVSRTGRVLAERLSGGARMKCLRPGETRETDLTWLDLSDPADIAADGSAVLFNESGLGGGGSQAVYLRKTDGSPAVRLGEGTAMALSPDGKSALARRGSQTVLLPTGAGQVLPVSA
ncbi:MAG TPA: protein kinase, partial [Thermoanaerobaculia bacterium]|nr:protein kinase [Thermoanaerobaculia bacterium]